MSVFKTVLTDLASIKDAFAKAGKVGNPGVRVLIDKEGNKTAFLTIGGEVAAHVEKSLIDKEADVTMRNIFSNPRLGVNDIAELNCCMLPEPKFGISEAEATW